MKNLFPSLITLLLLASIFLVPLTDTDFGWHYRCGQQIVNQGKLCDTNTFTTLLPNYQWTSPAQGYQVLIYFLYQLGGFPALTLFYGLSSALVIFFFLKTLPGNPWLKLLIFICLIWFAQLTLALGFRSQILSFYFFMILLAILDLAQKNQKRLIWVVPLMILWANFHPGFFLGPVIIFLYLLSLLTKVISKKIESRSFFQQSLVLTTAVAATLLNPFGLGIYQEAWRHFRVPLNTLIVEWLPPFAWQIWFIIAAGLTTTLILIKSRHFDLFRFLVLWLTVILALQARRSLPLFSVGLTYALLEPKLAVRLSGIFEKLMSRELLAVVFGSIFFYRLIFLPQALSFNDSAYCQKALVAMPCGAMEILKTKKPTNVFNAYEWGGFLEWRLPEFKFFVDGRMPTWNASSETRLAEPWRSLSPYTIHLNILYAVPDWEQILARFQTQYLLLPPTNELGRLLKEKAYDFGYREIYRDEISVLYEKT